MFGTTKKTIKGTIGLLRLMAFESNTEEGRSLERHRRIAWTTVTAGAAKVTAVAAMFISVSLTLEWLATKLSLNLYSHRGIHILTDREINERLFRLAVSKASWIGCAWAGVRMDSFTFPDHLDICRLNDPADVS